MRIKYHETNYRSNRAMWSSDELNSIEENPLNFQFLWPIYTKINQVDDSMKTIEIILS